MPTILFCGPSDDKAADAITIMQKCEQSLGVGWKPPPDWHFERIYTINQIAATSYPLVLLLPGWVHREDASEIMSACIVAKAVVLELRDFAQTTEREG
jgi:hypothetical protein